MWGSLQQSQVAWPRNDEGIVKHSRRKFAKKQKATKKKKTTSAREKKQPAKVEIKTVDTAMKQPDLVKVGEAEDSLYKGKPLLKPDRPYEFKYEYRVGWGKSDQSFLQKASIIK